MERELRDLPSLSPNQQVAIYVVRKVCDALSGCLEHVSPTIVNHDLMEGYVRKPLEKVVIELANFRDVKTEDLSALITAPKSARLSVS